MLPSALFSFSSSARFLRQKHSEIKCDFSLKQDFLCWKIYLYQNTAIRSTYFDASALKSEATCDIAAATPPSASAQEVPV